MNTIRIPALLLLTLYLTFITFVLLTTGQLPERVATHFNGSGQPDGWMSRSSHLQFILILGLAFPLFIVGLLFVIRFLPNRLISLPKRDYWLAPERRAQSFSWLFKHSLWFASIAVCFFAGLHYSIIHANSQAPPHLPTPLILGIAGFFLAGIGIWTALLIRHFRRTG